ncbi:MAG: alpha-amylase family glycosyl hydrolase [Myxococcales bacterium]
MKLADGVSLGARPEASGVRFLAWSDTARAISLVLYETPGQIARELPLVAAPEAHFFGAFVAGLGPGALYDFRVDGHIAVDPFARALPCGVHGPGQVTAPLGARRFPKRRIVLDENEVFYELHVGTFTHEGRFESAAERLPELRALGVTVVELMPVAAFAGARGWGYDGVGLFAPFASYGTPEELSQLVDAIHACGMSAVLDVVYNHVGPDGNVLPVYSDSYFDSQRKSAWGSKPDLEKPAFRRLILNNARYWLDTFGFDGLRLDATHELEPGGEPHILRELADIAHACDPPATLIAEDSRNDPSTLLSLGIDGLWSDDFHHVLHVLLTHENDGYYQAFQGDLRELARVIERGQLFEGELNERLPAPRGRPTTGVPTGRFLFALQNHDQVGNRARGERLHDLSTLPAYRAASLLLLFLPQTPLLFMGQEWAASTPFLYFSDHAGSLGEAVSRGRIAEFGHFSAFREPSAGAVPDPQLEATFLRSKIDWSERETFEHARTLELYRAALALRRQDPVLSQPSESRVGIEGTVLWAIRRGPSGERLLLFNPGGACRLTEVAGHRVDEAQLLLTTHPPLGASPSFEIAASSASIYALGTARTETR